MKINLNIISMICQIIIIWVISKAVRGEQLLSLVLGNIYRVSRDHRDAPIRIKIWIFLRCWNKEKYFLLARWVLQISKLGKCNR
jgi:hypothetical protein